MTHAAQAPETRRLVELVIHLAVRDVSSRQRFTLFGWLWPLVRQLAQLGVLLIVFSRVIDVGIANYPVFLFTGLVAWTWFASSVTGGATAIVGLRHLVFQPGCPTAALPLVPIAVAFVDVLLAAPVLLLLVVIDGDLGPAIALLPVIAAVQVVLMMGLSWLLAAANVYVRDVGHLTQLAVTLVFYVTPVFYDAERLSSGLRRWLRLNPMTTIIEAYRDVLIGGEVPAVGRLAVVAVVAAVVAVTGWTVFGRLRSGFVDEL